MENKVIVYDKSFEVEATSDINYVNELLNGYEKIDETTCLVWDIISCTGSYSPNTEHVETLFILGHKYKHIDHLNK